ncbi:hypothetical protein GN244_ATG06163 [Phytophthora infestans]|uniref:Uncharacterized protein n=1 Tax=Phytophthora infestans TaxID=4787 RepID=A0A833WXS9_PHYIN|nr:hypothetical protein GN244_ATG06163 [Phytophthora infestans]KAF4133663.1 hypothetical protein GN958_ATG17000 [Phytophthora infestans]
MRSYDEILQNCCRRCRISSSEIGAVVAVLCEQSWELQELRRQVNDLLVSAELKRELKVRHRLTASCPGVSHLSAWILLYKYGTDENLLNVTTLTLSVVR